MSARFRFLKYLAIAAVLVLSIFYVLAHIRNFTSSLAAPSDPVIIQTPTVAGHPRGVPQGFPESIPVERNNLVQSYSTFYIKAAIRRYTVSFNTQESKDALWKLYTNYLASASYTIDELTSSKDTGVLRGVLNDTEIDILILPVGADSRVVQVTYQENKKSGQ